MKDSIGSTLLLKIFTVFLVVYIIFMASILNYTKTFRVKNQIINIINRHGGYTDEAKSEISNYFSKSTIYGSCTELSGNAKFGEDESNRCEIKAYSMESPVSGSYYKVRLYVTFMFPLIKQTLRIPITGETKILYKLAPPGDQKAQYTIVDKSPTDTLYKFDIKTVTCGGSNVPGKACCSPAVCPASSFIIMPGGTVNGVTNSSSQFCLCYKSNGVMLSRPQLNRSAPGRRQTSNLCYFCYNAYENGQCGTTVKSTKDTGTGSSTTYTITADFSDTLRVGIKGCKIVSLVPDAGTKISAEADGSGIADVESGSYSVSRTIDICSFKGKWKTITSAQFLCYDAFGKTVVTKNYNVGLNDEDCCYVDNCKECVTKNNSKCQTCADGYNKNSDGSKCVKGGCGLSNCSECTSSGTCKTCNDGYFVNRNGTCSSCISGCKKCSTSTTCDTCDSDLVYENGKCVKNCTVSYCTNYEKTATSCKCTACGNNRVPSKSGSKCCASISNCQSYSNIDCTCSQCKNGYIKKTDGSCQPRGENAQ